MQKIHIFDAAGEELIVRDLEGVSKALLVSAAEDGVKLVETAAAGDKVIGALVPNEDGWALAAVSPDEPVTAGPKSSPDMQLSAGVVCALGGFTFRMEGEAGATGATLLWRWEGSKIVADPVVAGRNSVAVSATDARPAVNPPLAGEELFEFFPSVNGIDVISGSGDNRFRLEVGAGTLFSVGGFEGMYLPGAEAEAAMKSSNPFGWTSRKVRQRLLFGVFLLALSFLGAAYLHRETDRLARQVAEPRGAVESAPRWDLSRPADSGNTELMFNIKFYQAIPEITGPSVSPLAAEMIRRGELPMFAGNAEIGRCVKFVKDVTEIQKLIRSGRWDELRSTLAKVDRGMFTRADADVFLEDAEELNLFLNEVSPGYVDKMLNGSYDEKTDDPRWLAAFASVTNQNIFYTLQSVRRSIAYDLKRVDAIARYCDVRGEVTASGDQVTAPLAAKLHDAYRTMGEYIDTAAYAAVVSNELVQIRGIVRRLGENAVKRVCDAAEDDAAPGVVLGNIAELAESVGLASETVAEWRLTARESAQRLEAKLRTLYQKYRLLSPSDPAKGREILDEMLRLSAHVVNRFGTWARQEARRLEEKKTEETKQ